MSTDAPVPDGGRPSDDDAYRTFEIAPDEAHYETVVRGVATVTCQDPLEMQPLAYAVDPDVFENAFDSNGDGTELSVTFTYQRCEIVATQDRIHVRYVGPNL